MTPTKQNMITDKVICPRCLTTSELADCDRAGVYVYCTRCDTKIEW